MPILFGFAGIILIVAAVRDRITNGNPSLIDLLKADFTGQPNFVEWMLALVLIGSIGYIPKMQPIARGFLVLVIIGMLLSNKGFFVQLGNVFNKTNTQQTNTSTIGNIGSVASAIPTGAISI